MKPKSAYQNLQQKSPLFFSIGLVIALSLVITAFEWKTEKTDPTVELPPDIIESMDFKIIATSHPIPPKPKPVLKKKPTTPEPEKIDEVEKKIKDLIPQVIIDKPSIDFDPVSLPPEKPDEVHFGAEEMPSFEGGENAFYEYLSKKLGKLNFNVKGQVAVYFVIDKEGKVTDAKIIKGIREDIDAEILKILESSPKWSPGKQRGVPVKVGMSLPIMFSLQE